MSSRKLDELATDVDDASLTVEELQDRPDDDAREKLEELHKTLEDASNTIDELEDEDRSS
jgi:ATP-dependent helicase/DNAse subunit B